MQGEWAAAKGEPLPVGLGEEDRHILFAAIEKVAITSGDTIYIPRTKLREAIYATKDFKGLTGVLSCGQYGDCGAPLIAVYQVGDKEIGGSWPPAAPVWPK